MTSRATTLPWRKTVCWPETLFAQCAALFALGASMRICLGIGLGAFNTAPNGEMFNVARSIVNDGVFGNPNGLPSGPTAFVPPIFPYLLAAVLTLTPSTRVFSVLVTLYSILAASLIWALLPVVAESLALPRRVGLVGGVLGAANPIRRWAELIGYWDTTLSALCLMGMVAFTFSRRSGWATSTRALAIGGGWGLMCLLQPAAVMVFIVLLGVLILEPNTLSDRIRATGLSLLAFLLVLTPWTIRNYDTFGGLMFVRGNLGVELSVWNNDGATTSHESVISNPLARHPHVSTIEFNKRNQMGELAYDKYRRAEAMSWMAAHPARFAWLTVRRFWRFWAPERSSLAISAIEGALSALAVVGLLSLMTSRAPCRWLLLGIWTMYPLLYYFVLTTERYRYPIEWSIVLAAAAGVFQIIALRKAALAARGPT